MPPLEHIPDHQARALARLAAQYQGSDSFTKLVSLATAGAQQVENALWDAYVEGLDFQPSPNRLTRSQEFDDAAWGKINCSIIPNVAAAPDGTLTADKLVEAGSTGQHYIGQGDGGEAELADNAIATVSVYAQAAGRSWMRLSIVTRDSTDNSRAYFDLSGAGAVGAVASGYTASIVALGGGIYRCSVSGSVGAGTSAPRWRVMLASANLVATYTGDGVSGLYLWGAQLEAGSEATAYQPKEGEFTRMFLDTIGKIVGQPREGRDDETYRIWIRARVRLNKSGGTPEDILAVFAAITQGSTKIVLEEQFPAGIVVRIGSSSIVDPVALLAILQQAKAAGVQAILEAATSIDTTSFAFDPNGAGFGTASSATDSTAGVAVGATTIPVLSSTGFAATSEIVVEPGANEETRVVQSVAAGQIIVTVALSKAHASGVEIRKSSNTGGTMATAF